MDDDAMSLALSLTNLALLQALVETVCPDRTSVIVFEKRSQNALRDMELTGLPAETLDAAKEAASLRLTSFATGIIKHRKP